MTMPAARLLPLLAALLLGAGAALLVACGGSETRGGIPSGAAQQMDADLAAVGRETAAGECDAAERALTRVRGDIVELPSSVDDQLVEQLTRGADNLATRVPLECEQNAQDETPTDTTPTETTPTETTPTETTPTETTPTETTPTETTPTDTTPTDTTPTDTTPTETTPDSGSGGASPDSGTGGDG
jgi:cell division septation protein DedD